MAEIKKVTRAQIRAAEILNDMGRGNDATRAIAAAKRRSVGASQTFSAAKVSTPKRGRTASF